MSQQASSQSIFSEVKQSIGLSLPLIVTFLVQSSSSFVGTIMLAHLGTNALAAGAIVGGIYMTIVVFLFGLLAAVSVLVSQSYGAKDHEGVSFAASQGFIVSLMVTVPMAIAIWFSPLVLKWTGQNPAIVSLSAYYLHALVFGIIPLGFAVVMEQFLIGIGKTKLVLFVSLMEVPMEIFFCYVLIFGKFGFPRLGIAGLAYGFAIVFIIVTVILWAITHYGNHCRQYHIFSHVKEFHWKYIKELFRVGAPIGTMYIIEVGFYMIMSFLMGHFGVEKLAAQQIVQQFSGLSFMIIYAVSQAASVQVGHAVGRNDLKGLKRAAFASQGLAIFILLLVSIAYWVLPVTLMRLDIDVTLASNQMIIHYAVIFFAIMAVAQLGDTCRFIVIGILRGLKDTKIPLYVSVLVFWAVALPLDYLLAFRWEFEGAGLWWGVSIGIIIGAAILWGRFFKIINKIDLKSLLI